MELAWINFILEDISLVFIIFMVYMCFQQKRINEKYARLYEIMIDKKGKK